MEKTTWKNGVEKSKNKRDELFVKFSFGTSTKKTVKLFEKTDRRRAQILSVSSKALQLQVDSKNSLLAFKDSDALKADVSSETW